MLKDILFEAVKELHKTKSKEELIRMFAVEGTAAVTLARLVTGDDLPRAMELYRSTLAEAEKAVPQVSGDCNE